MYILLKLVPILSVFLFLVVPGFDAKEAFRKYPVLAVFAVAIGIFFAYQALSPLLPAKIIDESDSDGRSDISNSDFGVNTFGDNKFLVPRGKELNIRAITGGEFTQRFTLFESNNNERFNPIIYQSNRTHRIPIKTIDQIYSIEAEHRPIGSDDWLNSTLVSSNDIGETLQLKFEDSGGNIPEDEDYDLFLMISTQ